MTVESLLDTKEVPNPAPDANKDGKPAEGGTPAAKDTPGDKGAEQGADANKEVPYEIKAPEGIEFEPATLTEFTKFAKDELKLPLEQAQKLAEWYGKTAQAGAQKVEDVWKATNEGWVKATKEDKEIGGDKFEATLTAAKAAITKFGNPALIEALNVTGFGNHPEAVRFFAKVQKAMSEDNMEQGVAKPEKAKSAAEILFGS